MALEKTVSIEGTDVKLKASAALPRLYRTLLGRDLFEDFSALAANAKVMQDDPAMSYRCTGKILDILECLTFVMAKHAAPEEIPDDIETWLSQFSPFAVLSVQDEVMGLWSENTKTLSTSKKNLPAPPEK